MLGQEGGDILTDGLSDQATRLLEFHMLYGTKKIVIITVEFSIWNVDSCRCSPPYLVRAGPRKLADPGSERARVEQVASSAGL